MSHLQPHPFPPPWADAWGTDDASPFPFAEIEVSPGVSMRLRWIPPGRFEMGSPSDELGHDSDEPQHWVELSSGLWLAETACTQAQWAAVMGENPSQYKGDEQRPVEQVSWEDCQRYCAALNERHPGLGARLPTEAEWEYACRAGTKSAYNDGSACTNPSGKDPALEKLGWYDENSGSKTHPVGEKAPNDWGLYDMHGNVWEWCVDWYGQYSAEEQQDPVGAAEGQSRVVRGGSWYLFARRCRSAYRNWRAPGFRRSYLGFRLAAVQPR